jgi:hypothetical protein
MGEIGYSPEGIVRVLECCRNGGEEGE